MKLSHNLYLASIFLLSFFVLSDLSPAQFVQQGPKLVGTGAVGASWQGQAVCLSADGNTAILAGPLDSNGVGATWIFTRTGEFWMQQGEKLVGNDHVGASTQGAAVALSADGNTALIGGNGDDGGVGAAWVFTRSGGVWTQEGSKLVGSGYLGSSTQGRGVSLSSDGNTAIVGGNGDNGGVGASWVFKRSGGVWTQQGSKLVGIGSVGASSQGIAVAVSGDGTTFIVGGEYDATGTGASWIFAESAGVWSQTGGKLVGSGSVDVSWQGHHVAMSADGNTAMVGGYTDNFLTGASWVFVRVGSSWIQQGSKLVGSGASTPSRQGVGVSLSADGNRAIIGGYIDNGFVGAAWIFDRVGSTWTQLGTKLVGTGASGNAWQAVSVAISADGLTAMTAGYYDNSNVGAAWIFTPFTPIDPGSDGFHILSALDIPNDQGGQLRLAWTACHKDTSGASPQVTMYSIWRKSSSGPSMNTGTNEAPEEVASDTSLLGYDYVMNVPALQLPGYQTVVPTLEDSGAGGIHSFDFKVVAHTVSLNEHYITQAVSGYSVDNLTPLPPAGLSAWATSGSTVQLWWNTPDPDIARYDIYRSDVDNFDPLPSLLIASVTTLGYLDLSPPLGTENYYRVKATDVHGNEGPPSQTANVRLVSTQAVDLIESWNLISVPLTVQSYAKQFLFPTSISAAFAYKGSYAASVTLKNGVAYWVKYSGTPSVQFTGVSLDEDTVEVRAGWNLVGSISSGVAVSDIVSIPPGEVTSQFYGYDGGYAVSDTIRPGRGYWLRVGESFRIVLSHSPPPEARAKIRISISDELPPTPPEEDLGAPDASPKEFSLGQNYPNPFNPVTRITYTLRDVGFVSLKVFNILGEEIATLVDEVQSAGVRSVDFNADGLPSGIYVYRIVSGSNVEIRKMLYLK